MKPKKGIFHTPPFFLLGLQGSALRTAGLTYTNKSKGVLKPIARTLLYQEE